MRNRIRSAAARGASSRFLLPLLALSSAVALAPLPAQSRTAGPPKAGLEKLQGKAEHTLPPSQAKRNPYSRVDSRLPKYRRVPGISGSLHSVGSDTLNNLMTYWAEAFKRYYPQVRIQVEGKGSSTAPPALIEGTAQFGPMSRVMMDREVDDFVRKFGYKPTKIGVAVDALALFVNKDNPLDQIDLIMVDSIFSSTRKRGGRALSVWGSLGLRGEWAKHPFSLYGRNSASGTYGYFKTMALKKGDFRNGVKEQPGSASVVRSITEDIFGLGYSGIGYRTAGVKALSLLRGGVAYSPTDARAVLSGRYPLSRVLFIYIHRDPKRDLDPLVSEFLRFVLSREGQTLVEKDGFLPLPWKLVQRFRAVLGFPADRAQSPRK